PKRERKAVARRHSNQGRAAHLHRLDGVRHLRQRGDPRDVELVRQTGLIDDLHRPPVGAEGNGSSRPALYLHPPNLPHTRGPAQGQSPAYSPSLNERMIQPVPPRPSRATTTSATLS